MSLIYIEQYDEKMREKLVENIQSSEDNHPRQSKNHRSEYREKRKSLQGADKITIFIENNDGLSTEYRVTVDSYE